LSEKGVDYLTLAEMLSDINNVSIIEPEKRVIVVNGDGFNVVDGFVMVSKDNKLVWMLRVDKVESVWYNDNVVEVELK